MIKTSVTVRYVCCSCRKGLLLFKMEHARSKMDRQRWRDFLLGRWRWGCEEGRRGFHKVWMPSKNVSSDPCEVVAEWEDREGRDRRIDDRRPVRKVIHVHSCISSPALILVSISQHLSVKQEKRKSGAADDRGRTVRVTRESLSSTADRTQRSPHTCVYSTFSSSKERVIIHH